MSKFFMNRIIGKFLNSKKVQNKRMRYLLIQMYRKKILKYKFSQIEVADILGLKLTNFFAFDLE